MRTVATDVWWSVSNTWKSSCWSENSPMPPRLKAFCSVPVTSRSWTSSPKAKGRVSGWRSEPAPAKGVLWSPRPALRRSLKISSRDRSRSPRSALAVIETTPVSSSRSM